jgi:hypothetical protein
VLVGIWNEARGALTGLGRTLNARRRARFVFHLLSECIIKTQEKGKKVSSDGQIALRLSANCIQNSDTMAAQFL